MHPEDDIQAVQKLSEAYRRITAELGKVIVGQQQVIEELLIAMFARGHCLLVGVPGLAKTLMIRTLADALSLRFNRIQFTPDLMPSDITGTEVIQEDKRPATASSNFSPGRSSPTSFWPTKSTARRPKRRPRCWRRCRNTRSPSAACGIELEEPFFVLATQNPIEQEGTYPLPEAQLDRFMFNIMVDYPTEQEEFDIVKRTTADVPTNITQTLSGEEIVELTKIVRRVPVADHVTRYALQFARLSRRDHADSAKVPDFIRDYVSWGAGPRASQFLVLAAKARAVLHGRYFATCDDVRTVAPPVLRHRIMTNFNAEADGIKPDDIVRRLIEHIPADETQDHTRGKLPQVFRAADAG